MTSEFGSLTVKLSGTDAVPTSAGIGATVSLGFVVSANSATGTFTDSAGPPPMSEQISLSAESHPVQPTNFDSGFPAGGTAISWTAGVVRPKNLWLPQSTVTRLSRFP